MEYERRRRHARRVLIGVAIVVGIPYVIHVIGTVAYLLR